MDFINPTTEEVRNFLISTLQHVSQVEHYLNLFALGSKDQQRPHDIVGAGNKFEYCVLRGLALGSRDVDEEFYKTQIEPSILIHRAGQYHHQKWNEPAENPKEEDMMVGATDALSSLFEDRGYQGGTHDIDQIRKAIERNTPEHSKWMEIVFSKMKEYPTLDLEAITSVEDFPNTGVPSTVYDAIVSRTAETVDMLRELGYRDL